MNRDDLISETFEPVTPVIDGGAPRYHSIELMSRSATACIYRAVSAGKRVVIKTPADDSAQHLDLLKREYTIWCELDHQNVARVYTWETHTPVGPGIVMEYIDGLTLAEYLDTNPSPAQRRRLLAQLLDGVEYLHHTGIVHNDLKTGNLMVSRRNHDLKIIDFGYADCDAEFLRRQLGGTAGYASPELQQRSDDADARSDIYSIGVIMDRIFSRRYRTIRRRCCQTDPARRYPNIESLRRAFRRRLRIPIYIAAALAAIAITAAISLAVGIIGDTGRTITDLKARITGYAQSTQLLSDSIGRLNSRIDGLNSTNTSASPDDAIPKQISIQTQQIQSIQQQKTHNEYLLKSYTAGIDQIMQRHAAIIKKAGVSEAFIPQCPKMRADIDKFNEQFIARNGDNARTLINIQGEAIAMKAADALYKASRSLPSLKDLVSLDEYQRIFPLLVKGEPYTIPKHP